MFDLKEAIIEQIEEEREELERTLDDIEAYREKYD